MNRSRRAKNVLYWSRRQKKEHKHERKKEEDLMGVEQD